MKHEMGFNSKPVKSWNNRSLWSGRVLFLWCFDRWEGHKSVVDEEKIKNVIEHSS